MVLEKISGATREAWRLRDDDNGNEGKLADFDADVEKEQCQRNGLCRQSNFIQRAGEAQAVQQTERESDHPRGAFGESWLALASADDFRRDEHDAQRNTRLDRDRRHARSRAWLRRE